MASPTPHRTAILELHRLGRGLCGGVLFALPAIYTMELWWLGYATPAWHVVAILFITWMLCFAVSCIEGMAGHLNTRGQLAAGLAIALAALMIDIAGVRGHVGPPPAVDHHSPWPPALVTYAIALLLAALLIWALGYGGPDKGFAEALALMVALAMPMTVGAAAGRLIL